jgi:hypothetical protein
MLVFLGMLSETPTFSASGIISEVYQELKMSSILSLIYYDTLNAVVYHLVFLNNVLVTLLKF